MSRVVNRFLRTLFIGSCVSLMLEAPAIAAPGDLDATFSSDGKVTTNFTRETISP
jgi:hypothetical protein